MTVFDECLTSERYANQLEQDLQDGLTAGVRGTPTYFLNHTKIEGSISTEEWGGLILKELQNI